jgi:hypothetical protein
MEKVIGLLVQLRPLVVVVAACIAAPAIAQSSRDSVVNEVLTKFSPRQPIQVALLRSRWTGRFERVGGDTLFIASPGQLPMAFRFNAVDSLWRQGDHVGRGAWIGGTTLGVFGVVILNGLGREGFSTLGVGAGLGLLGALTGGWIGSAFKRWVAVYP